MAWESEASDAVPEVYEDSTVTSGPPTQRAQKEEPLDELQEPKTDDEAGNGILPREDEDSEDGGAQEKQVVSTAPFQKFSEEVQRLFEEASRYNNCELDVRTYFDLQGYNLESFACRTKKQPGSLLMMYMFYSRIFEKLVGKQKGVEVALFSPVDFEERLLGFRAVLEWAKDFKMMPQRVPKRQLERIFVTCHAGDLPSHEKIASKITYSEFLMLMTFCASSGEPMDLSRVDGSLSREVEPRLEQVKRLATFLSLRSPKQVKLNLHNAYRDVHFWKLSDGADFEKEARAAEMRARPHYEVATLEIDSEVPAARRYLDRFTWSNPDHIWEEFEAPFLDMGTCFLNRPPRRFKLDVYNRGLVLARLQMELLGTGPLRAPWHDCMLGPGQRVTVPIDIKASEPGEWHGYIRIRGAWVNVFGVNEEEARIPTHLKVERADCGPCGPPQLPVHAPRPFRPGSANRIRIDPSSLHTQQLRTPTPHKLKRPCSSSSASSAKPESARPVSSRNGSTAVPSSRPLSALGPPSSRGICSASAVPSSRSHIGRQSGTPVLKTIPQDLTAAEPHPVRPRSAPLAPLPPRSAAEGRPKRPSSASQVRHGPSIT